MKMNSFLMMVRIVHFLLCGQTKDAAKCTRRNDSQTEKNPRVINDGNDATGLYITKNELETIIECAVKSAVEQIYEKQEKPKEEKRKPPIWMSLLFMLNVVLFPFYISKKFKLIDRVHDGFLTILISLIMLISGCLLWIGSAYVGYRCVLEDHWNWLLYPAIMMMFGSLAILASRSFRNETNSERIYAYSASIFALIGCVASWVAILSRFGV